jgi:hypothetical protein
MDFQRLAKLGCGLVIAAIDITDTGFLLRTLSSAPETEHAHSKFIFMPDI